MTRTDHMPRLKTRYQIELPVELSWDGGVGHKMQSRRKLHLAVTSTAPAQAVARLQVALQKLLDEAQS